MLTIAYNILQEGEIMEIMDKNAMITQMRLNNLKKEVIFGAEKLERGKKVTEPVPVLVDDIVKLKIVHGKLESTSY